MDQEFNLSKYFNAASSAVNKLHVEYGKTWLVP